MIKFLYKCRDRTLELLDNVSAERELNAYGNYNPFFIYLSFQVRKLLLQIYFLKRGKEWMDIWGPVDTLSEYYRLYKELSTGLA